MSAKKSFLIVSLIILLISSICGTAFAEPPPKLQWGVCGDNTTNALAIDDSCNVYVTGYSPGINTIYDYMTVKYSTDGHELWVARYDCNSLYDYDRAVALAVDSSDNVYVTGESCKDYATIKYSADGNQLWVARYDTGDDVYDYAYATDLVVDDPGNVYVTGCSYNYETDPPTGTTHTQRLSITQTVMSFG
jgi:hypothetical protein